MPGVGLVVLGEGRLRAMGLTASDPGPDSGSGLVLEESSSFALLESGDFLLLE